jgi:hypothetical protein
MSGVESEGERVYVVRTTSISESWLVTAGLAAVPSDEPSLMEDFIEGRPLESYGANKACTCSESDRQNTMFCCYCCCIGISISIDPSLPLPIDSNSNHLMHLQ